MLKFKYLLVVIFTFAWNIQFLPLLFAQERPQTDLAWHLQSPYKNSLWDGFVEEGFKAWAIQDAAKTADFLKKAVNLGCQSPLVYTRLGMAHEALGLYGIAVQYYELAAQERAKGKSNFAENLEENWGRALFLMDRPEKALPLLLKASATSQNPWVFDFLGRFYLNQNKPAEAAPYFDKLLNLPSQLPNDKKLDLCLTLARAFAEKKDEANAKKYYALVLTIDPNNPEAKKINSKSSNSDASDTVLKIFENH